MMWPHDEGFIIDLNNDPEAMALAAPCLIKPPNKSSLEGQKTYFDAALLAVIICVRKNTAADDIASSNKANRDEDESSTVTATAAADSTSSTTLDAFMTKQKSELLEIGTMTLSPKPAWIGGTHRNTNIGIVIAEPYRNKGYGREAIEWVTDYAFNHIGMHRVQIGAYGFNEKAWKLYERIGFKLEGRLRESIWRDGRWWDEIDLGMLEGEFRELKKKREMALAKANSVE